jgi:hypothetical protein
LRRTRRFDGSVRSAGGEGGDTDDGEHGEMGDGNPGYVCAGHLSLESVKREAADRHRPKLTPSPHEGPHYA